MENEFLCAIKPTQYKFIPFVSGILATLAVVALLYLNSTVHTYDDIITEHDNRSIISAISSEEFIRWNCIFIGILVPLVNEHVINLSVQVVSREISQNLEAYLFPMISFLIETFNIYFVAENVRNDTYYWMYLFGTAVQIIILGNTVFIMQINAAQKLPTLLKLLVSSAILFNLGIVMKVWCWLFHSEWNMILSEVLLSVSILLSLGILYQWYLKYRITVHTGVKNQPDFFNMMEMLAFVLFLVFFISSEVMRYQHAITAHQHVIARSIAIIIFYYLLAEVTYLKHKEFAKFSMEALETKRSFVRYVSHEIRTPLNAATMGLELLSKEISKSVDPEQQQHTKHPTISHTNQLLELVADTSQACGIAVEILNDLLLYEKIDGGLLVLDAQEVLFWPFVEGVLKMFAVQVKALELELLWQPLLDMKVYVNIDCYKMSQVLRNLVSNALKFSPPGQKVIVKAQIISSGIKGSRSRRISASQYSSNSGDSRVIPLNLSSDRFDSFPDLENRSSSSENLSPEHNMHKERSSWWKRLYDDLVDGHVVEENSISASFVPSYYVSKKEVDMLRISITDFGAGISKENQKRLFNEIVQFNAAKLQQGKGSGIGLWITNKIMKLHGGRIGVESEGEGMGSTFYIDIPITRTQFVAPAASASAPAVTISNPRSKAVLREMLRSIISTDSQVIDIGESNGQSKSQENSFRRVKASASASANASATVTPRGMGLRASFSSVLGLSMPTGRANNEEDTSHMASRSIRSVRVQSMAADALPTSGVLNEPDDLLSNDVDASNKMKASEASKRRLLIVDDSAVNRKMLRKFFWGHFDVCDEAMNGIDAMKCINKLQQQQRAHRPASPQSMEEYDLIVLDYFMPEMNGLEVVQRLRQMQYTGKIVGLTGNTEEAMKEAFLSAGADMVLIKPLQGEDLQRIIDSISEK